LTFIVPPAVFLVSAAVFPTGREPLTEWQVAVYDGARSTSSTRFIAALSAERGVSFVDLDKSDSKMSGADAVRVVVDAGAADIGLIISPEAQDFSGLFFGRVPGVEAPLTIVTGPARGALRAPFEGLLQRVFFSALQDVALRNAIANFELHVATLTPEQRERFDLVVSSLATSIGVERPGLGFDLRGSIDVEERTGQQHDADLPSYFTASVIALFLMFRLLQSGAQIHAARDENLLLRLLAMGVPSGAVVVAHILWFTLQGTLQAGTVLLAARAVHDVPAFRGLDRMIPIVLLSSAACAAFGLAVAATCRTRAQAELSTLLCALAMSAVGGSMVPRLFMPGWLLQLGWLTPNTWIIDGVTKILWHDAGWGALLTDFLPLVLVTTAGTVWSVRCLQGWGADPGARGSI
jgi:ABC-2 type transport system permease protein